MKQLINNTSTLSFSLLSTKERVDISIPQDETNHEAYTHLAEVRLYDGKGTDGYETLWVRIGSRLYSYRTFTGGCDTMITKWVTFSKQ